MNLQLYNKAAMYPIGRGYDLRQKGTNSFTVIIHSTNGNRGSSFTNERDFLLHSSNVSAHFLIGKQGQIVQYFDDIARYRAWHTGAVLDQRHNNNNSIGIECHYAIGESTFLPQMKAALIELGIYLRQNYTIIDFATHRAVAKPKGRKLDPSHLSDAEFIAIEQEIMTFQSNKVPILGHKNISIDILRHKLNQRGVFSYEIDPIIVAYTYYGELTGMGNVYPLAQAAHETGWFKSPRWITSRNPAGLGATNDGAWGHSFKTIAEGVLAHTAHLLCYATKPEDNSFIIEDLTQKSPRRRAMESKFGRGSARNWNDLSGKWNWPSLTYHEKVFEIAKWLTT